MKVEQTYDTDLINSILRDESIFPHILLGREIFPEQLDAGDQVNQLDNVFLLVTLDDGEVGGVFTLIRMSDQTWEVHTSLLPNCRGELAIEATMLGTEWMFTRTACRRIVSKVPDNNKPARLLAKHSSLRHEYRRENCFTKGSESFGIDYVSMTIYSWIWDKTDRYQEWGRKFHEQVEPIRERMGINQHPDDPAHDTMAGFAFLTALNGQPEKALDIYNEWAVVSGYQPLSLLAISGDGSYLVDMREMQILIRPDGTVHPKEGVCQQE